MTERRSGRGFGREDVGKFIPCLSLSNPWPWTIFDSVELSTLPVGMKRIENRSWWIWYRGPVWLCTSAQSMTFYYDNACAKIEEIAGSVVSDAVPPLKSDDLPAGVVRGLVYLTGSRWSPTDPKKCEPWEFASKSGKKPNCAARFEVLHKLDDPIPVSGMQGFWRAPHEVELVLNHVQVKPAVLSRYSKALGDASWIPMPNAQADRIYGRIPYGEWRT